MRPLRSSEVLGIVADTPRFVREASRETHSNSEEYGGGRRGEDARPPGLDRDGTPTTLSVREVSLRDDSNVFDVVHSFHFIGEALS